MRLFEFNAASDLPESWDRNLGTNIYLSRSFLRFMEGRSDAQDSRYYMFTDDSGAPDTRFMLFTRKEYVITQFTRFSLKAFSRFVYVPLSVARAGVHLGVGSSELFFEFVRKLKGMRLVFNLPGEVKSPGFVQVMTCPRCVLDVRWSSFDGYMADLRSHYRNRYKKALKRSSGLRIYKLADNSRFGEDLYALYLQVLARADYKIETLSLEFFRGSFFDIFVMENELNQPVAFYQLLENGDELIFEFTGFDAELASRHDAYNRMLMEIIRHAIENGFKRIDFGQTAEEAKLRIGCRYEDIYVLASHSNPILNLALRIFAPLLNYKPIPENSFNVFRTLPAGQEGSNP
ncbi:MAG: GNAT family N-acetyltransferase [Betaproteobacteria bacterium]|nr:GNAT family N-acetyltransferase [Betaproteobacteria bacterium]